MAHTKQCINLKNLQPGSLDRITSPVLKAHLEAHPELLAQGLMALPSGLHSKERSAFAEGFLVYATDWPVSMQNYYYALVNAYYWQDLEPLRSIPVHPDWYPLLNRPELFLGIFGVEMFKHGTNRQLELVNLNNYQFSEKAAKPLILRGALTRLNCNYPDYVLRQQPVAAAAATQNPLGDKVAALTELGAIVIGSTVTQMLRPVMHLRCLNSSFNDDTIDTALKALTNLEFETELAQLLQLYKPKQAKLSIMQHWAQHPGFRRALLKLLTKHYPDRIFSFDEQPYLAIELPLSTLRIDLACPTALLQPLLELIEQDAQELEYQLYRRYVQLKVHYCTAASQPYTLSFRLYKIDYQEPADLLANLELQSDQVALLPNGQIVASRAYIDAFEHGVNLALGHISDADGVQLARAFGFKTDAVKGISSLEPSYTCKNQSNYNRNLLLEQLSTNRNNVIRHKVLISRNLDAYLSEVLVPLVLDFLDL